MSKTYYIDGTMFAEMIRSGAVNLRTNASIVNELNVFPIPDGDTGENMSRTMEGGVAAVSSVTSARISDCAETVADGMLMAARGNSGVILSQFFDGLRRGFVGVERAGLPEFKAAMRAGVEPAYSSVVQPTEGTILTVMRESVEKANMIDDGGSMEEYFTAYMDELYKSLDRTPELLPVLKESGVIDSGGAGFSYIIEGMNDALCGTPVTVDAPHAETVSTVDAADTDAFDADSKMEFGYCTELIIQLMRGKVDVYKYDVKELIGYLESMGGESIVAFKTGTRIKLHVHTFEPEKVFAYCRTIGEFVTVKVENMSIQHSGAVVRNRFKRREPDKKHKKYACVAVADGAGLIEQFKSLGADFVIDGKQTMNPSTADFLKAFDAVDADTVFVFPNNSNIILAAKQAADMYDGANVVIIPSKTLAEGYSAMSMLDYSSDSVDEITEAFNAAAGSVTTGLVSYAIRDCALNGCKVKKGDYLGFDGKTLLSCNKDLAPCACELLDKIDKTDKSVIIAVRGLNVDTGVTDAIEKHLKASAPSLEFYEFDGGQDVYSIIFIVE